MHNEGMLFSHCRGLALPATSSNAVVEDITLARRPPSQGRVSHSRVDRQRTLYRRFAGSLLAGCLPTGTYRRQGFWEHLLQSLRPTIIHSIVHEVCCGCSDSGQSIDPVRQLGNSKALTEVLTEVTAVPPQRVVIASLVLLYHVCEDAGPWTTLCTRGIASLGSCG